MPRKNCDKYDEYLEIEVHAVIRTHEKLQACLMLDCVEEHVESNSTKDEESR